MDKWLKKARQYIMEHNAFDNVSEIMFMDTTKAAIIHANVIVSLPSQFIKLGKNDLGVKNKEEIQFIFSERFPLESPKILLRDDFPRCFPHINPTDVTVNPCIYAGDLSELLQQSEWMNGILNQVVDWLEKAASNDLMNYDQGWEPMRNDHSVGYMRYTSDEVISAYKEQQIFYEERNGRIITDLHYNSTKKQPAHVIFVRTPNIINDYVPNTITKLSELCAYADSIGIHGIMEIIVKNDSRYINENKLFVIFSVKRPINLIDSNTSIEFLNFVIHKSDIRKNKQKSKKRVLPECKVDMLSHISNNSPALFRRLSGIKIESKIDKPIALVGCGSLGSKIGVHLARHGNEPFLCIDNDFFLPHNNARHALIFGWIENKAEIQASFLSSIGFSAKALAESAITIDYSQSNIIIDTTASLSVRNFFMKEIERPPVISGGLYGYGRYGLLLLENKSKTNQLTDIWAHLYYQSLTNLDLNKMLFSSNLTNISIGQSCSSQTMVANDAQISLMAAAMGLKIQNILDNGLSQSGEILFLKYSENYSLQTEVISVPECISLQSIIKRDWKVFLSNAAYEQMKEFLNSKSPNETGGVLLGSVFTYAETIIITGLLPAPPDSIEEKNRFILGTEGLADKIKDIEKKTNGKVTYLGTWHSHPFGGSASQTDKNTYKKLLFVRNYEPTICLIITPDAAFLV
ncbi:Mov34/MPN/PAD-1 family protein [Sporomusa sphaeroides]|uniref:Mov34/MPN/PAD-1 family protein n=1 Tax=Sporomusa sphaeroides TaxID=47679 RepID=UPI002BF9BBF8|nr:Mov34/MPN/PAD-1 family protein [Sporomusa sphaeroides]HML31955.1 Mov34/MPN/PAD-1 family protein [Sporomusa sphaeroides]